MALTRHEGLNQWIDEMTQMCQPDKIVLIDGSDKQRQELTKEACSTGMDSGADFFVSVLTNHQRFIEPVSVETPEFPIKHMVIGLAAYQVRLKTVVSPRLSAQV